MARTWQKFFWTIGLCLQAVLVLAQAVPPKPSTLVNDYAGVLSSGNKQALERKLVAYDDSTSTQIAIAIEKYLESDDAFDRSIQLADSWGIGRKGKDNGVLIYIAIDNRKIFIQNGYGVEDRLTDAMTRRIIDQVIVPNFRSGNYYRGLDKATSIMIELMEGRYTNDQQREGGSLSPLTVFILFLFIFFLLSYLMSRGDNNDDDDGGYYRGGRYRGPVRRRGGWIYMPSGGGFGSSGGGFGGGGFGGFGGGGFGGGGAGGSW